MDFVLLISVLFSQTPYISYIGGRYRCGQGEIKMASASTPSGNKPAKDFILVHTIQLKPMIKAHFSGRMVSSGISDVVFTSVHYEKTRLKKLIMIIIIIVMKKSQEMTS